WIGLAHHARKLRGSFQQQDAGKDRFSRKVAAQEGFIAAYLVGRGAFAAGLQRVELIQKAKSRPMREQRERLLEVVFGHRAPFIGSTSLKSGGRVNSNFPATSALAWGAWNSLRMREPSTKTSSVPASVRLVSSRTLMRGISLRAPGDLGWS